MSDKPLSYWVAVARMGFQDDFSRLFEDLAISQAELARRIPVSEAYASKFLNGAAGNYELSTMVKWARAVGGIVQVRVIREDGEVVRVVDYETARTLDEKRMAAQPLREQNVLAKVFNIAEYLPDADGRRVVSKATFSLEAPFIIDPEPVKSHG